MSKQKTHLLLFVLISLILIYQLNLSLFGNPYHFHPDEGALLKRPLKLLLLYKNGDFSSSISVYVWIQNIWYGISFLIGKFFNLWPDFQAFKNSILLEKWEILFLFRILSIILTMLGHLLLIKLLRKLTKNNLYFLLISSVILFNPITLLSTFWVKYEAMSYLTFSLISYYSFKYFILNDPSKTKLYFILFLSFAVRIELSIFVFFILYFDYKIYHKNIMDYFYKNLKIISKGCVLFLIISLYPLVLYSKLFGVQDNNIGKFSNYGEAIYNKIIVFQDISIYSNALLYYSSLTVVIFFPLLIVIIKNFKNLKKYNFLIYPSALFFIIIILFGKNIGTPYFLLISVVITILYVNLLLLNSKKIIIIMSTISFIYFLTLNFELIYYVNYTTDSRILSKNYITSNVKSGSKILLEDYGNNGSSPSLNECTACSAERYKAIIEIGGGTGAVAKLKSEMAEPNPCYQIVDLFSKDYLKGSSIEKKYIILKSDFEKKVDSLEVFDAIILNDPKKKKLLKTKLNKKWKLKSFLKSFPLDPRLRLLIKHSHFNPKEFHVFTKN
jgi:hypothetical protein